MILVYTYIYISSSSSRAGSTDIPDPFRHSSLSFIALGRSSGQQPVSSIAAECTFVLVVLLLRGRVWGSIRVHLLWVHLCFSSNVCMSGSPNLNSFRDRGQVAVQLVSCWVLPPGLGLHAAFLCIAIYFFSSRFVSVHVVHPYSSIDVTAAWKKLRFILSVRSDFHIVDSLLICPCFR